MTLEELRLLRLVQGVFVRNYVDTHGQSELGFAFCSLLGFQLLPRLKNLHAQKLYRPETGHPDAYPNLQPVLTRPIKWELIRQQYDEMVKFATALRLGTAASTTIRVITGMVIVRISWHSRFRHHRDC